jgi:opacity protein-like surface antigen
MCRQWTPRCPEPDSRPFSHCLIEEHQAMRVLGFVAAVIFPALASAQTTSVEVFGTTGIVTLWDDESKLGTGASFGVGAGVRLPSRIGIEVLVERHETHRRFEFPSDVRFDSDVIAARVRLAKYFFTRVQPYVGGGFGVAQIKSVYDSPADCGFGASNQFQCLSRDIRTRTTTSPTLSAFGGVRFAAGQNLFVRPEFEFLTAKEHLRLAGTVAVGWGW